jgi:hypothetical protein
VEFGSYFTLGKEHRLKVFENRVPIRIFGPERRSNRRIKKIV